MKYCRKERSDNPKGFVATLKMKVVREKSDVVLCPQINLEKCMLTSKLSHLSR